MPNWADIVTAWAEVFTAIAALATIPIAAVAWFTSVEARRHSMRPVVRPVRLVREHDRQLITTEFKLKNYGLGPAIGVMLFNKADGRSAKALGAFDIVEVLGDGDDETKRIGNVRFLLNPGKQLTVDCTYRLLYQDIEGHWHETVFTIDNDAGKRFSARYLGRKRWWKHGRPIPLEAVDSAAVVRAEELVE